MKSSTPSSLCRSTSLPNIVMLRSTTPELKSFKRFSDLPREIRRLIWGFVCLQSRQIVLLDYDTPLGSKSHQPNNQHATPPILSVNKESRVEALKHYEMCRVYLDNIIMTQPSTTGLIYVNFDVDELMREGSDAAGLSALLRGGNTTVFKASASTLTDVLEPVEIVQVGNGWSVDTL